jgi:hypothetical protein
MEEASGDKHTYKVGVLVVEDPLDLDNHTLEVV